MTTLALQAILSGLRVFDFQNQSEYIDETKFKGGSCTDQRHSESFDTADTKFTR